MFVLLGKVDALLPPLHKISPPFFTKPLRNRRMKPVVAFASLYIAAGTADYREGMAYRLAFT